MPFRYAGLGILLLLGAPFQTGCAVSAEAHALGHVRAAAAAMQNYDYTAVQTELTAARSIQGPTPDIEALQAAVYQRIGLTDRAEESYRRAAQLRPDFWQARCNLAALLIARGRSQEAIPELEAALALDPDNTSLLNNLGIARRAVGDMGGASEALARAVSANPRDPHAASNHGIMLFEDGHVPQAMRELKAAVYMDPTMADARAGLAVALWAEGRHATAVAALTDAHRFDAAFGFPKLVGRKYHWPPRALAALEEITPHMPRNRPGTHAILELSIQPFGATEYLEAPLLDDIIRDRRLAEAGEQTTGPDPQGD